MQRDREDLVFVRYRSGRTDLGLYLGCRKARQWLRFRSLGRKDRGGPVTMMHVAINRHGPPDATELLHFADGDSDVMNHAKALAVIRISVVESAADVEADSIGECALRSQDGSARGKPEGPDQLRRIWQFHLHLFMRAQSSMRQALDVSAAVYQANIIVRGRSRLDKVSIVSFAGFDQPVVNHPVLLGWEDMCAYRQVVVLAVNKAERQAHQAIPNFYCSFRTPGSCAARCNCKTKSSRR